MGKRPKYGGVVQYTAFTACFVVFTHTIEPSSLCESGEGATEATAGRPPARDAKCASFACRWLFSVPSVANQSVA